ncbi:MAG: di-trans,poly-cis-decaprenylcistransferase [Ruminiclostridium sp.]|nr:di-trans,poly-cis-decaprenylcistransferase [Ruminiclostridium sp.]
MSDNLNSELIIPKHIGIIMDGNGRWAKKRGLPRTAGHIQGAKTFRKCVGYCRDFGVECVTFYAFSTENWKRPKSEVDAIMNLFSQYLDDAMKMTEEDAKFIFLGDPEPLSDVLKQKIKKVTDASAENKGIKCCIAINYGGRDEIVNAVKKICEKNVSVQGINEQLLSDNLYTAGLPDVDLIIRPSGEQRISNFLIWQSAYAEFVFMDVLWPDFEKKDLEYAITEYSKRNRRFGGI